MELHALCHTWIGTHLDGVTLGLWHTCIGSHLDWGTLGLGSHLDWDTLGLFLVFLQDKPIHGHWNVTCSNVDGHKVRKHLDFMRPNVSLVPDCVSADILFT